MPITIFQFFHWYYPAEKKLWNEAVEQAVHLKFIGISHVWLPPAYKSSAGINGVGYDVYDLFDLGEFNQKGYRENEIWNQERIYKCHKKTSRKRSGCNGRYSFKP